MVQADASRVLPARSSKLRALTIPPAARVRVASWRGARARSGAEGRSVALRKRLDGEVGEDRCESLRHSCEVVGVAASADREVDRPVERSQRFEVEVAMVERVEAGAQTGGSLGHPWWGWPLGRRRWLHAGG